MLFILPKGKKGSFEYEGYTFTFEHFYNPYRSGVELMLSEKDYSSVRDADFGDEERILKLLIADYLIYSTDIVPRKTSAGVICFNSEGKILGIKSKKPGRDGIEIPAGGVDDGEPFALTAVRECLEETGIVVEVETRTHFRYFKKFTITGPSINIFKAKMVGGELKENDECVPGWFDIDELKSSRYYNINKAAIYSLS